MARVSRILVCLFVVSWIVSLRGTGASAASPDTCLYDDVTKTVTVTFPDEPDTSRTVSREPGGPHILYNGAPCGDATVKNTKVIDITGGSGAQFLTIDQRNGRLRPPAHHQEIPIDVDLGVGTDTLAVVGTPKTDWMLFTDDGVRLGSFVDETIDISTAGVDRYAAYGIAGNDEIRIWNVPGLARGQGGDDRLLGGLLPDLLDGGSGKDELWGSRDRDVLEGGRGSDWLRGSEDADELYPGPGNDDVSGGADDDLIVSGAVADGADAFGGGAGTDTITYEARTADLRVSLDRRADDGEADEHDRVAPTIENVFAGAGNDRILGTSSNNVLAGAGGDDRIFAGWGADQALGGAGNDAVEGDGGDDLVRGGEGDDVVGGGSGDDTLVAEADVDGTDRYRGDDGTDTLTYDARTTHVKLSIGVAGSGAVGEHDRIDGSIEVLVGGGGRDRLIGSEHDEVLMGGGGRDRMEGGEGADRLYGERGDDAIVPGDGFDQVWAGEGDDVLHLVDEGADVADCGDGVDDASDRDTVDTSLLGCETT